jgi:signal peptidase I, bacterial type
MSTIILASLGVGLFAVSTLLWALSLCAGLHWAKIPTVTMRRIALATILVLLLQIVDMMVSSLVSSTSHLGLLVLAIGEFVGVTLATCLIIVLVFKATFWRALQAWLPTLATPLVMLPVVWFVIVPFVFEGFKSPTNAMAPTLLGDHWQAACVECGGPAYCSPRPQEFDSLDAPEMICRDNFHVTQPTESAKRVFSPDRFIVAKFLTPQRWDVVAFRFPGDRSNLYVMRLVGLPGEEITIKDGEVWVNDQVAPRPDAIRGIKFLSEVPGSPGDLWGSPQRPAKLEADEYFVLGDFSSRSFDSRLWEQGAFGHNPFAVPQTHMMGVVTHIYWPPSRWRTLR